MDLVVETYETPAKKQKVTWYRKNDSNSAKITITFQSKTEVLEMCKVFSEVEKILKSK